MSGRNHGNTQHRLHCIEYLRGLAALSVTWFHVTNTHDPGWVNSSGSRGWLGVEVFFVISGFILPLSIARMFSPYSVKDFPRFVWRRVVRLEPPYLMSIVLTLILWQASALAPGFAGEPPQVNAFQVLSHVAYLIPFTGYGWIQPVYWTLAYEFTFYIVLGLSFRWVGATSRTFSWVTLCAVLCCLVGIELLPSRVLLFVIGVAVYRAASGATVRSIDWLVVATASLLIARTEPLIAIVGASTGLCVYFFGEFQLSPKIDRSLIWLGRLSYSLYLVHVPIGGRVVNLGKRFVDDDFGRLLVSLIALAVSVMFARVFMHYVERPAIVLSRRV